MSSTKPLKARKSLRGFFLYLSLTRSKRFSKPSAFALHFALLQLRLAKQEKQPNPAATADIVGTLTQRVRERAVDRAKQIAQQETPVALHDVDNEKADPSAAGSATRDGTEPAASRAPMPPNELTLQLSREPRAGALQPHMGDQLKQRTFEYVNHALAFAHQGDVEAADAYARLAESALRTAVDYLSESEYRELEADVLSRIQSRA